MKVTGIKAALGLAACVLAVGLALNTSGIEVTSVTPEGPVDATANFTLGLNSVSITLINNLQNPTSAGQLISGISFKVIGASGSGILGSVNSGNITTITVPGGSYTAGVADSLTHWIPTEIGTSINLTTLTGAKPFVMIIGPDDKGNLNPALGGHYSAANSSIGNFNPSVLGSATFTINVPGVTAGSQLTDIVFQFGTGPDSFVGVPDNGTTVALLGLGLTCLGLFRNRFAKRA